MNVSSASRDHSVPARLSRRGRPRLSAHEPKAGDIGHFERRHLFCDLPELDEEEDESPGELEGGPEEDGEGYDIVGGGGAEGGREETRVGDGGVGERRSEGEV